MNERTEQVFKGFLRLTDRERQDLIRELNQYQQGDLTSKKSIEERFAIKRLDLGPLSSDVCPCCGK